ncbi:hypothetical protein IJT93_07845 [bacterium]|nr:hypothetical protein [bacterium]
MQISVYGGKARRMIKTALILSALRSAAADLAAPPYAAASLSAEYNQQ